jgi:hypothetical protein
MSTPEEKPAPGRRDARRQAMMEVAERVGGSFVEGRMTGGYAVAVERGRWTLMLGLHTVHSGADGMMHTRVTTHFEGRDDFRLIVRRRSFLDRMAARLGFGGLRAGGRELLERHLVRGRPESRVRSVLSGGVGEAILETDVRRLEVGRASWAVRRKRGPRMRTLQVTEPGLATDVDRMVAMVTVAGVAMDVLERVGLASPGAR